MNWLVILKNTVLDLMDEVWEDKSFLIIKNNGKEERVEFTDIKNISYSIMTNQRVSISLRRPCIFGSEISFAPHASFPFTKNKDIIKLIDRVDMARFKPS